MIGWLRKRRQRVGWGKGGAGGLGGFVVAGGCFLWLNDGGKGCGGCCVRKTGLLAVCDLFGKDLRGREGVRVSFDTETLISTHCEDV